MGQIDQLLRRVAGAPVRTVRRWRSRGISWKVITSNLLPEPSLSIIHHHYLPELEMNLASNLPARWRGSRGKFCCCEYKVSPAADKDESGFGNQQTTN